MSRSPRRASRVKPPLRGRAATRPYRGQYAPIARLRPAIRPLANTQQDIHTRKPLPTQLSEPLFPSLPHRTKQRRWRRTIQLAKRWPWLIGLVLGIASVWLFSHLL